MKRAKHNLSHYRLTTAKMGELIPLTCVPVLPGDTFQHSTSALIRVSPLNTPVMHPVSVRLHHWFVPNRIVWPESENGGWEQFITGGPDGDNAQTPPQVNLPAGEKSVSHYLGVPKTASPYNRNALPLRAFNKIYNERYRDQDLVPERTQHEDTIPHIAWEKDQFGVARPWTQKGPEVTVPIGERAYIKADLDNTNGALMVDDLSNTPRTMDAEGVNVQMRPNSGPISDDNRLYADLANATGVDVNTFRAAFAVQRYQEARARYGSRFVEYLRYLGIKPSDARLQEPEYLGGGVTRLNFSEVLQTAPGNEGEAGVGDMYGHGIAGVSSNAYRKFFEEHGYVITLLSVRPKAIYINGLHREWIKKTKEDYFQKELSNLGQQEVYTSELHFAAGATTFGYQDRYEEYRSHPSQVTGDFTSTLSSWHLGRELSNDVVLNQSFIECDPSDRIYQVPSTDQLWIMANHRIVARRMVPKRANPRIL